MININKTNIIVLALIYNYIATKEKKIKKTQLELFFSELNYDLLLNEYKLISEEETEQNAYIEEDIYIKFINLDRIPYSLIDLKRKYIDVLPNEVIELSLSSNVLSTLKINRNDIQTKTCLEPIYSLDDKEPSSTKIKRKIKLNPKTIPTTYKRPLCYSIEREVIDIDSVIEEYENKQK